MSSYNKHEFNKLPSRQVNAKYPSNSNKTTLGITSLIGTIADYSEVLKSTFAIEHFSCHILYPNSEFISLSNNLEVYKSMHSTGFIHDVPRIVLQTFARTGFYLLDKAMPPLNNYVSFKRFFKINSFRESLCFVSYIAKSKEPLIVMYTFDTSKLCHLTRYNICNNIDLLQEFCRYFLTKFKPTVEKFPKIAVDTNKNTNYKEDFSQLIMASQKISNDARNLFTIWLHKHKLSQNNIIKPYLTKRESEILKLTYQKNYTSKQVADYLQISRRTVDRHFENMRLKFMVIDKLELINKAFAFGLVGK